MNDKNRLKIKISEQLQQLQFAMHRAVIQQFGNMRNPLRGQGRVLALLKLKPKISQKELTYLLNMSRQAAAELINKLERSGYITREPSEHDKRIMMIQLTEAGAKAADDMEEAESDSFVILDCLSEDEMANFSEYLERIIRQSEGMFPNEKFEQRRRKMEDFMSSYGHGFDHHNHHDHHRTRSPFMNGGHFNESKDEEQ